MLPRFAFPLAAVCATALFAGPVRAHARIYIPVPLTGEHPTALGEAADRLNADFQEHTAINPPVTTYTDRANPPTPVDGFIVTIGLTSELTGVDVDGYRITGGPYLFHVHAHDMPRAIEGLHGLRLALRQGGYAVSSLEKVVNPAFERRGMFVRAQEDGLTQAEWPGYIDRLQLLGANTLTVGLPGLFVDDDPNLPERYESDFLAVEAAMEHCELVGMRFQLAAVPNVIDRSFFWDHFEPSQVHYLSGGTVVGTDLPDDPVGASSTHDVGGSTHLDELLPFNTVAASLGKLATNTAPDPVSADLATRQAKLYDTFQDADGLMVVVSREAADFSSNVVDGTTGVEVLEQSFHWISARVATTSSPDLLYWGWQHDLSLRALLNDHDYTRHPSLDGSGYEDGSYTEIWDEFGDFDAAHSGASSTEWVQEVGFLYPSLAEWIQVEGDFDPSPMPSQLVDPLGHLDTLQSPIDFEKTAFLYWCDAEDDPHNRLLRPAIRETIAELRAALRKDTLSEWPHTTGTEATGMMGYRFNDPRWRPLNDYVTLRCASDEAYLDLTDSNLDATELDTAQQAVVEDLAAFLAIGNSASDLTAVTQSVDQLDDSRPGIDPIPTAKNNAKLRLAMLDLYDDVEWWTRDEELANYYHLLSFTYFLEDAADEIIAPSDTTGDALKAAINMARRVAQQTPILTFYSIGNLGQGGANIGTLVQELAQ